MPHRLSPLLRRIAADPLTHFLALGLVIFGVYAWTHPQSGREHDIVIGETELARLRSDAKTQWGREPDALQMQGLVDAMLREEVLVREALALGLDRDDTVVRRRLAQKMEFLAQQDVRTPDEADIQAWYQAHPSNYQTPARVVMEQRYFAGPTALQRASAAVQALRRGSDVTGERFMLARAPAAQDRPTLARDYGDSFAEAVWNLPLQQWSEPLVSPHGVHLVRLLERHEARPAPLNSVRDTVAADLLNQRIARAREDAYQAALARYRVTLPTSMVPNASTSVRPHP